MSNSGFPRLEQRLRANTTGGVFFDPFNRGRYATDASFYQVMPLGVVVPRSMDEALRALSIITDDARIVTPCGGRSLRYGTMRDNTLSMDAALADGSLLHFGEVPRDLAHVNSNDGGRDLFREMLALGAREAAEIAERFPKVQRRVGGYNIDALVPGHNDPNLAHILVGSEGTLAFSTAIEIKLSPLLGPRSVGACHFGSFPEAMAAAQHIVKLAPIAVELIDSTMIGLARDIAMFRPALEAFVRGEPAAVLLVEFA